MPGITDDDSIQKLVRLVELIRMLGQENGTTVTEIAGKLGISRWTVSRMLLRLSSSIAIKEEKEGRENRLSIDRNSTWNMTLPNTILDEGEKELFSILMGMASSIPILGDNAGNLQGNIKWLNSAPSRNFIVFPKVGRRPNANTSQVIMTILKALNEKKWVTFEYYKFTDDENNRYTVAPAYLFMYDDVIWLRARDVSTRHFNKTFAIERIIGDATITEPTRQITVDDDSETLKGDPFGPFGSGGKFTARIKLTRKPGYIASLMAWPEDCDIEEQDDGSFILTVKTNNESGLISWILEQGSSATVLEPEAIKSKVISRLRKALKQYQ